MSYTKMMKWNRKHPKGINYKKGWMGFDHSTPERFTPSIAFLEDYWEYKEECKLKGINPLTCEEYYKTKLR